MHGDKERDSRGQQLKEALMFAGIRQDLRFAIRQLTKTPGFAVTAILVFALGIAASTAIFAFVDAALIKPLPYQNPARLVGLFEGLPIGDRYHLSLGDYLDWKRLNHSFSSLDVYRPDRFTLKTGTRAEEVSGATVSDGFFRTLGVVPLLGRDFRPGEDQASAQQTVLLSYAVWQRRFAGQKSILGETLILDDVSSLIIGVLPKDFHFAPVEPAGYWTTLHPPPDMDLRNGHPYYGVARLRQGVAIANASSELTSISQQIAATYPRSNRDRRAIVIPLADLILGDIRPTLFTLLCGGALLCLIGFVDVSSLLLVRADSRRREIAVRGALGASRTRLVRQFAVEGFLLAGCGCVLGSAFSSFAIGILTRQIPAGLLDNMPYLQGLHFDQHLLLFTVLLSILGGVLFSVGPVLQLLFSDLQHGLMEGGRTSAGQTWRRMGAGLVAIELAITVVLLMCAGLLAKSFYRLLHEDFGITADHLALLHVLDQDAKTDAQCFEVEHSLRQVVAALPGTRSVGISEEPPVDGGEGYAHSFEHFRVVGRSYLGEGDEASQRRVSVGYLETLQARLLQGRYFSEGDNASKPGVAVINHTMAAKFFPNENPVGKRIVSEYYKDHPVQIVGIVDDIKDGPLDTKTIPAVYLPLNQNPANDFYVTVRTTTATEAFLPAMARAVRQMSSGLIVDGEDTMTDRINHSQAAYLHRSAAWLVGGFAAIALMLGTVGLYGVISYSVGQRRREIGVRMALGAQRSSVYHLILKEACWLAASGIAGGMLCSLAVGGLLRKLLFGVSPWDTATVLSVAAVLVVAALSASFFPARSAASIHPTEALRAE